MKVNRENCNFKKKSSFKESLQELFDIFKYSGMPFYKLRDEMFDLAEAAIKQGHDDWVGSALSIEKTKNEEYEVLIAHYFRTNVEDKFVKIERKIMVGELEYLPALLCRILSEDGKFELEFNETEVSELIASRNLAIEKPISLKKIVSEVKIIKKKLLVDELECNIELKDKMFYVEMNLSINAQEANRTINKTYNYYSILDLPEEVRCSLAEKSYVKFSLEI